MSAAKPIRFSVKAHGDEVYVTLAKESPQAAKPELNIIPLELEVEHDFGHDPYNTIGHFSRTNGSR